MNESLREPPHDSLPRHDNRGYRVSLGCQVRSVQSLRGLHFLSLAIPVLKLLICSEARVFNGAPNASSMNATEAVKTKLDVREFSPKPVPIDVKTAVLEAARLTQSGTNSQHWRFVLVQDPKNLKTMADDSTWGKWVAGANFAVIVCTDPSKSYHMIDAGRAVQDMQLTAWDQGVASCVFTGIRLPEFRRDFGIPKGLDPTIVVGFGYPQRKLYGKKNRKPLSEVAFLEKYGNRLELLRE